jgi:hypothetical protein
MGGIGTVGSSGAKPYRQLFFTVPVPTFDKLRFRLMTSYGSGSSSAFRPSKAVLKKISTKNLAFLNSKLFYKDKIGKFLIKY